MPAATAASTCFAVASLTTPCNPSTMPVNVASVTPIVVIESTMNSRNGAWLELVSFPNPMTTRQT